MNCSGSINIFDRRTTMINLWYARIRINADFMYEFYIIRFSEVQHFIWFLLSTFLFIYGNLQDRVIKFLPVNIFIGYEIFWNARLTLTRNHVKLEAEGSVHGRGPITCEWTTSDIVGIKSVWSKNVSLILPYLICISRCSFQIVD